MRRAPRCSAPSSAGSNVRGRSLDAPGRRSRHQNRWSARAAPDLTGCAGCPHLRVAGRVGLDSRPAGRAVFGQAELVRAAAPPVPDQADLVRAADPVVLGQADPGGAVGADASRFLGRSPAIGAAHRPLSGWSDRTARVWRGRDSSRHAGLWRCAARCYGCWRCC